jgi:hypothetical protein
MLITLLQGPLAQLSEWKFVDVVSHVSHYLLEILLIEDKLNEVLDRQFQFTLDSMATGSTMFGTSARTSPRQIVFATRAGVRLVPTLDEDIFARFSGLMSIGPLETRFGFELFGVFFQCIFEGVTLHQLVLASLANTAPGE